MSFDYEPCAVVKHEGDDWGETLIKLLKATSPRDRMGPIMTPKVFGPEEHPGAALGKTIGRIFSGVGNDGMILIQLVSPKTRAELPYLNFAGRQVFQHPDVPDDEAHAARVPVELRNRLWDDAEGQPVTHALIQEWAS